MTCPSVVGVKVEFSKFVPSHEVVVVDRNKAVSSHLFINVSVVN